MRSFLCMCALRHNMLTLQESVPISTGNKFQWCVWVLFYWLYVSRHMSCLWVTLTTADRVYNSCTAAWTYWKGYCLTPLLQCSLGGMNRPRTCMRKCWGVPDAHLILLISLPESSGNLSDKGESRTQTLLGWALAPGWSDWGSLLLPIQGSCPHSSTPLVLPWRVPCLRCLLLCPWKSNKQLLRLFAGQG